MKSTMKRCLAFATVLAMLLSVCALPAFAAPTIAAPCEHAADVEPETVIIPGTVNENTHSRYDKYECGECGAKWIANVVLNEGHDYEGVVDPAPQYGVEGTSTPTCKVCGYEDEAGATPVPGLVHSMYEELTNPNGCCHAVVTAPTCLAAGSVVVICDSGETENLAPYNGISLDQLDHDYTPGECTATELHVDCPNGCGGYSVPVVAEAPAHENCEGTIETFTRDADCITSGFTAYGCESCGLFYVMNYVEATGHNDEGVYEYTAQSCTDAHVTVKYCTACVTIANNNEADEKLLVDAIWNTMDKNGNYGLYAKETVAPALGHADAEGTIDPTVHNDERECERCHETFGHVWVDMETPATCTENGASWKECACGATKDYAPITAPGHTEILDEENSYEATEVADGLNVYVCETCGEKTRDDEVVPALYDIVFSATAKNQFNGIAYVQNSIVAYTVALNAADLAVGSIRLAVSFDAALTYMGYDLGADNANAFGAYVADNMGTTSVGVAGNVVTVYAYSANYSEGQVAPVVLDGEQEFVTLYFAVNSDAAAGAYALSIASCEVMNVDLSTDYDVNVAADVAVVVETLGDLNGDNAITIEDQMIVNGFIASSMNESAPLYDVHADINQDGIVDFADLYVVNQYLNTSYTLEMLLAVGDVRPAPEA